MSRRADVGLSVVERKVLPKKRHAAAAKRGNQHVSDTRQNTLSLPEQNKDEGGSTKEGRRTKLSWKELSCKEIQTTWALMMRGETKSAGGERRSK